MTNKIDRMIAAYKAAAKEREHEYLESHRAWAAKARMFPSTVSLPEDRSYVSQLGGQAVEAGAKPKTQGPKPKGSSWW